MSFNPQDRTGNIEGLSPDELEVLQDWEYKFMEKYEKVGRIVLEKSTNNNTQNVGNTKETDNGAVEE